MLQQPARPSGNVQLPYTTADMAEHLAKRKAAKDRQDILDSLQGGLSYGKSGVDITPQLSQVGGMVKGLIQMPGATIMDIASGIVRPLEKYVGGVKDPVDQYRPEDYGTSNLITGTAQGLEQAGRRAVGDITAIPGVGKPSASPTATDIKRLGVIEGLSKAGIDYGNLALTAAPFVKPSAFGISNAYKDMLEARLAYKNRSPFPTVKTPGSVIDVDALQGSRLPARIVDTPASPATRLAEAQTQRALPPAQVAPGMTAQLQRQAARTELGLNIQDIEFPPKGNELLRPMVVDSSNYGVFPDGAWEELGLAQHNAGINNATMPQEMDALRVYFGHDYESFQDLLRNPNMMSTPTVKIFQNWIEKIDNIFKVTSPTTENFKVFRGVNADSPMPDGAFVGAFYRSLKEGDFIVEPAYMSTSISKTTASEWANSHPDDYLLIIHAPKGSVAVHPIVSWEQGIDEITQHMHAPSEQELLFNRGTVLKILSNDFGVIEAEMVPIHQQVDTPISTSEIRKYLLKQYSYKDLAEMVVGEQSKVDFYVEHFQTLPDLQEFLKSYKATNREYDLANTVVELNKEVYESINTRDYWKFRDIVDQIVDANKLPLTTNNRYAVAKELLLLSDKHGLLYDGTTEFIRNNLDDIFQKK